MPEPSVIFSHGKESGPWGTKIKRLAVVAEVAGFRVESLDYRGLDQPEQRVEKLIEFISDLADPILVGSSMGAYVSAAVAERVSVSRVFLMAPACFVPGYEAYDIRKLACPATVVHGWHDEVIPVENAIRFARQHRATLHVLDDDHRLTQRLDQVVSIFRDFLESAQTVS